MSMRTREHASVARQARKRDVRSLIEALERRPAPSATGKAGFEAARARRAAALALRDFDEPRVVRALCSALREPDETVRTAIVQSLASLRDPASIPDLAAAVAKWSEPRFAVPRKAALDGLSQFRDPRACTELATALARRAGRGPVTIDDKIALASVARADATGTAAGHVARALVPLLREERGGVAARAEELLTVFPVESVDPLIAELRYGRARSRAAHALGATSSGDAVHALIEVLQDESREVRAAAAEALGAVGDPIAAGPLEAALSDSDELVRSAASKALGGLGLATTAAGIARAAAPPSASGARTVSTLRSTRGALTRLRRRRSRRRGRSK
jgi:HEAT repeat protein